MVTYVSLLRSINVGGNNKIKMADLRALYETLGFENVRTVLQTGNIIFEINDSEATERSISQLIDGKLIDQYGVHIVNIIRTSEAFDGVCLSHPFTATQLEEPSKLIVMFLSDEPEVGAFEALTEAYTGQETMVLEGQELYVHYVNGIGRSKLTNAFIERHLKVSGTGRNWNTVEKIVDKMR